MKCQSLFSGKNKKNIISLSSAEYAQSVGKVKVLHVFLNALMFVSLILSLILDTGPKFVQLNLCPHLIHCNQYHSLCYGNSADDKLIFFLFFPENRL